ncbi:bifunctional (p)ppGpp synthetase/guanosine-3',5'-bis(diphosphate) 3'-pyrophosphohydrolase, partial [bacterium]|nr:bifunctional (p)ppGpp synthetase/guanosine-3',5'-bis(diphosphate) 3'-pyrophosphohydrolase [bacterium]
MSPASALFPIRRRTVAGERAVGREWRTWSRRLARRGGKKVDMGVIGDAFWLALHAHRGQRRRSGEPYITHPLEVARLLTKDAYPGDATVAAALLHDTVEDTPVRALDLLGHFGQEVTALVLGLTKLETLPAAARDLRTENLRKIFLVAFSDARVLLIKLADRLHNLRTLEGLGDQVRARTLAEESKDFYSPLAGRFGFFTLKTELDDEVFRVLEPGEHARIKALYKASAATHERALAQVGKQLAKRIRRALGGDFQITWRVKNLQSTARKMGQEGLSFDAITDLFAVRVIVPTIEDCYRVLGIVHALGTPLHGHMTDYIAAPKANGYQSLHTVIEAPNWNRSVEVQVRTLEMDRVANWGAAAHWMHKEASLPRSLETNLVALDKFRAAFGWTSPLANPQAFVSELQKDFFAQRIFVFTPDGDKISLPRGATALDFAFAVHTELGSRTKRTLVNGREAELDHRLELGDEVRIVKAKSVRILPEWSDKVVTVQARREIRSWLRDRGRGRARNSGRRAFEAVVADEGLHHLDLLSGPAFAAVRKEFGIHGPRDLYEAVGRGALSAHELVARLRRHHEEDTRRRVAEGDLSPLEDPRGIPDEFDLPADLLGAARTAPCCLPVPGDSLMAVAQDGTPVIHREECARLAALVALGREAKTAAWGADPRPLYPAEITLTIMNRRGTLLSVLSLLDERGINLLNSEVRVAKREVGYARYVL